MAVRTTPTALLRASKAFMGSMALAALPVTDPCSLNQRPMARPTSLSCHRHTMGLMTTQTLLVPNRASPHLGLVALRTSLGRSRGGQAHQVRVLLMASTAALCMPHLPRDSCLLRGVASRALGLGPTMGVMTTDASSTATMGRQVSAVLMTPGTAPARILGKSMGLMALLTTVMTACSRSLL